MPMAEVPFRPVRQLSEYKGIGASASREHSKGIVDEQIARFAGNFARNFMIFGQMIDKR